MPAKREKSARHTLQPEYVAPQTHTARAQAPAAVAAGPTRTRAEDQSHLVAPMRAATLSKPLPNDPPQEPVLDPVYASQPPAHQKMPPPVRPGRDVPRSVSDSTGAFATAPMTTSYYNSAATQATRPSTQGSLTSASGPSGTRSDLRLPSRGSYGQPVAPTVATTNVQGRVTQPSKSGRGYNISGPISSPIPQHAPQHAPQSSMGQPMTQAMPPPTAQPPQKSHHRRSSTLSGLGERLFGRSNSVAKKNREDERQKNGKKYPPTSMKDSYATEAQPRMSTDSKRSFFLGKKRSTDLDSSDARPERPARRSSLIPSLLSFKGLTGNSKDRVLDSASPSSDQYGQHYNRPPTDQAIAQQQVSNNDGMYDGQYDASRPTKHNNFSRPPQGQHRQQASMSQPTNDVYGGTGVYASNAQPQGRSQHQRQASQQPAQLMAQYPDGFNDSRPSMQQERKGKLVKNNNRKFNDGYDNQSGPSHHNGSSGAVKKVQDFFRRRGRARADSEYR